MDEILGLSRRAQRRLAAQRFLDALGWCWLAGAVAALVVIGIDKRWPLGVPVWCWGVSAFVGGLLAAAGWAVLRRPGRLAAAIEIDRRFALKERVSSAIALPAEQRDGALGQALIEDARRRAERVDLPSRFPLVPRRSILLPLLPGAAAALVALWVDPWVRPSLAQSGMSQSAAPAPIKKSTEALRRRLADRRKQAEELGLDDAEHLLRKLEDGANQLPQRAADRKQALIELNDLARQLEARRDRLGESHWLKQQLDRLKDIARGPADELAKALSKGDFQRAAEQLDKLAEQLRGGKLDEQSRRQLADQVEQIKQKLQEAADAHQAAQQQLQAQADRLRQAGQADEADRLQEAIDKLAAESPRMERLRELADQLAQCSDCLKDGRMADASEALGALQAELENMRKQAEEAALLDEALEELAAVRQAMTCPDCGGAGCKKCQGNLAGPPDGAPGDGIGVGHVPREQAPTSLAAKFYDSQVRPHVGTGSGEVVGLVPGPNVKGNVAEMIRQEYDSARRASIDPLGNQPIPRAARDHAQEYFNRFREGK